MKVLLKPYPQKELGIILFRPASDALQLFSGKRLLITDEPADLQSAPDGLITGAHQKVLDNPVISNFLSSDLVIRRMLGGWVGLTRWVKQNRGCQCDDPGYHHHEMTHARRERGVVGLCWHHDTQYRDKASAQLDAAALANTLEYVSERIRYWLGEREGHQITVAEICWFAVARGFVDKLPRAILYDILAFVAKSTSAKRRSRIQTRLNDSRKTLLLRVLSLFWRWQSTLRRRNHMSGSRSAAGMRTRNTPNG